MPGAARPRHPQQRSSHLIAEAAEPFGDLDELTRLAERFAHRRVVLLGEATHGTAEFYDARARITAMLVEKHGFNIVAVEADWPDAAVYDAYVRGLPRPKVPQAAFTRFPTWMWRNGEVADFLKRLKDINATIGDPERRCGFYGLDVYSLSASIEAVLLYLDKVDPEAARIARERYGCLAPWRAEPGPLRAHGAVARLCGLREAGRRCAARSPAEAARLSHQGRRGVFRRRAECAHRRGGRAILPRHVLRRRGVVEFARPAYVRHAGAAARSIAGPTPRRWSGRTTRISAMPSSPRWARSAASTISASSRASASARMRR